MGMMQWSNKEKNMPYQPTSTNYYCVFPKCAVVCRNCSSSAAVCGVSVPIPNLRRLDRLVAETVCALKEREGWQSSRGEAKKRERSQGWQHNIWTFPKMGVPNLPVIIHHPFFLGIFHEIIQPAISRDLKGSICHQPSDDWHDLVS